MFCMWSFAVEEKFCFYLGITIKIYIVYKKFRICSGDEISQIVVHKTKLCKKLKFFFEVNHIQNCFTSTQKFTYVALHE